MTEYLEKVMHFEDPVAILITSRTTVSKSCNPFEIGFRGHMTSHRWMAVDHVTKTVLVAFHKSRPFQAVNRHLCKTGT